ncbi:MAG: NAD(P)H-dependent oxidoreductase [Rikenellaceae bacterium]|nr:NAD(P)H-dependent oxidoreductase [Rikenellaceae bacterium]
MKKLIILIAVSVMTLNLNTSNAQDNGKKILLAWYSWGGNTETVGKYIQEITGADIFIIEPVEAYSTNYNECVEEARTEINAGSKRPIKGSVDNIDSYDIIIVGTPNWWSTMAPPVMTFLTDHDLSGKTIAPFVTHGGGREARCFSDMEKAVPQAKFLRGFVVSGNRVKTSKSDVENWLREIDIIN